VHLLFGDLLVAFEGDARNERVLADMHVQDAALARGRHVAESAAGVHGLHRRVDVGIGKMSARAGMEIRFDRVWADAMIAVNDDGFFRLRGRHRRTQKTGQSEGGSRSSSHYTSPGNTHPAAIWPSRWGESMTGLD
jgi:hypothetical protein